MALEFTDIPDRNGAAVYLLSNGQHTMENELRTLGEEIDRLTPHDTQVVLLDSSRGDGIRVKEFYSITTTPTAMIILDDDTVPYQWTGSLPQADQIAYHLNHIEGSIHSN